MGDEDWDYDLDDGDGSRHGDDAFRRRGKVLHVVGALVVLLSLWQPATIPADSRVLTTCVSASVELQDLRACQAR